MEAGFGGPVWHASTASTGGIRWGAASLEVFARETLDGLGDAALGEWSEMGKGAFHVRRRLTDAEQAHVGPMLDVRGSPEAARRVAAMAGLVPALYLHIDEAVS